MKMMPMKFPAMNFFVIRFSVIKLRGLNFLRILFLTGLATPAWSHQSSGSYLYLNSATAEGRLDVAIVDLQRVIDLDDDGDAQITWQELTARQTQIDRYVQQRFALDAQDAPCSLTWQTSALTRHVSGQHLAFPFAADCPTNAAWKLHYSVLFDRDALHRALVQWNTGDASGLTVLSPEAAEFTLPATSDGWQVFLDYFHQGVLHLLIGYDHILFLLALLLPVVARLLSLDVPLRSALRDTLGIVTLFTAAHSCTLALSALQVVQLPAALVEVLIALSVSGAGVVALVPAWHRYRYGLAFGFGLVHGFGFANVLAELAATWSDRIVSLAAFNLGVEAGQVLLIGLSLPVIYLGRGWLGKARWSVPGSASGIVLCGLVWAWQRL